MPRIVGGGEPGAGRRRGLRAAALVVGACLVAGACGLGDKQARAERIIDAVEAAYAAGGATGTLTIAFEVVSLPEAAGDIGLPGIGGGASDAGAAEAGVGDGDAEGTAVTPPVPVTPPPPPGATAADATGAAAAGPGGQFSPDQLVIATNVAMDLGTRRAWSSYRNAEVPYAAFDEINLFGRRHNAGPRDARPWVFVDAEDLEPDAGGINGINTPPFLAGFALSPVVVLDLASAPLTGSVEQAGTEDIAGVRTTHYKANFDIEKMTRDTRRKQYPEKVRESLETLLDLVVVKGTTHPGEVWVGDDGLPRRFRIKLRQEPFTEARFDLILTLDLAAFGTPQSPPLPTAAELVKVGTVLQFVGAAVPGPGEPAFLRDVMGVDLGG